MKVIKLEPFVSGDNCYCLVGVTDTDFETIIDGLGWFHQETGDLYALELLMKLKAERDRLTLERG